MYTTEKGIRIEIVFRTKIITIFAVRCHAQKPLRSVIFGYIIFGRLGRHDL